MIADKKKHLSPSQITMYIKCSAQWMFRYVEGLKSIPSIALLYGSSFDEAANTNLGPKISTHEDVPVDDVTDAFVTTWDSKKENYDLTDSDGRKPDDVREHGVRLTRKWREERAPEIQPIAVQEPLHIEFPDFDYDIIQYADIITDTKAILDNKTSAKSPPKDKKTDTYRPSSFDHVIQLSLYDMGYEVQKGERPSALGIDYAVKTKEPQIRSVVWKPNDADRKFSLNLIGKVADGIKKQFYLPNRGHFLCTKRFCGYWRPCVENWGGTVKE